MTFKFTCPECSQRISVEQEIIGTTAACPSCQKEIIVPSPPEEPGISPPTQKHSSGRWLRAAHHRWPAPAVLLAAMTCGTILLSTLPMKADTLVGLGWMACFTAGGIFALFWLVMPLLQWIQITEKGLTVLLPRAGCSPFLPWSMRWVAIPWNGILQIRIPAKGYGVAFQRFIIVTKTHSFALGKPHWPNPQPIIDLILRITRLPITFEGDPVVLLSFDDLFTVPRQPMRSHLRKSWQALRFYAIAIAMVALGCARIAGEELGGAILFATVILILGTWLFLGFVSYLDETRT